MTEPVTYPETDRRREPRLKTLLGGIIKFDDHVSTMDCTIRSLSAYGGRIELSEAFRIPDAFDLAVPHHDQTHRAEVMWRRGDRAGLALSDPKPHDKRAPRHMTPRELRREHQKELNAALY